MNRMKESYEPKVVNGIYNGALMNLDDVRKSLPNNTPREIWNLYQELFDLLERENDNSAIEKQVDSNISDGTFTIYIQSVEAWAKEYKPLEGKTIPIYNVHRITEYEESICGVVGCDYCGEIMANDYTLLLPFSEKKINSKIPVSYEWINIGFIRKQPISIQGKQTINEYNGSYEKQAKNMKKSKQTIKLKEDQLRQIVKESIKKVLNETYSLPTDDNPKIMQQNVENLRIGILKNLSLFKGIKKVRVNFDPNCFDNGVDILEIEVTVNFNDRFLWHWVKKCEKEGKDSIDEYCKRLQNKINKIKILRYHKCLGIDDTNYLSNGEVVYRFYGVAEEDFEKDYFIR